MMIRLATVLVLLTTCSSAAVAQLTETPGYGGTRIAPGAPVPGYTPGGVGIGGGRIAPGQGAADVPMYRRAPGGVPVLIAPERGEKRTRRASRGGAAATPCGDQACLPEGLRLTIDSKETPPEQAPGAAIDTMQGLHAALRACWTPPAERQRNVQMSVRFSFRRSGEPIGAPFVTYATRGLSAQARQSYRKTITDAIDRCAPLKFSPRFAAAIAGQPVSVRFVDHRADR